MKMLVLVLCVGAVMAENILLHEGEDTVPTSNWAEVYARDSADFREPVVEESQYPVAEAASRSDWFHSYPYQKFEEREDEEPGLLESLGNTVDSLGTSVKDSVDSLGNSITDSVDSLGNTVTDSAATVRRNFVGVGEGVVNGALRLVGAETLREKQARARAAGAAAREGYVYHGTHLRGPGYRPGQARQASLQGQESQTFPRQGAGPVQRLRQGIRGVLKPIKNLFKPDGKQVLRRQQKVANPISSLGNFGSHVKSGFSKLTGLGQGATAKVSHLFPWLHQPSTEERAEATGQAAPPHPPLPTLPPVYVPATPEQLAEDSVAVVHRVPAPPLPAYVPESPPQHSALPLPPYPSQQARRPTHPPPSHPATPFIFSITPLIKRVFSQLPRPSPPPVQRASGSRRSLATTKPIHARASVTPSNIKGVMYYLPAPDLSGGGDLPSDRHDEEIEVVYSQPSNQDVVYTLPLPQEIVYQEPSPTDYKREDKPSQFRPSKIDNFISDDRVVGTSIEIDLSHGGGAGQDAWEEAKILETLRTKMDKEAAAFKELRTGDTVELAPTDTLVFDLSQGWGRLAEVSPPPAP